MVTLSVDSAATPERAHLARGAAPGVARGASAGVVLALALLFAAWQGYRNPDFLLGLATFRLC